MKPIKPTKNKRPKNKTVFTYGIIGLFFRPNSASGCECNEVLDSWENPTQKNIWRYIERVKMMGNTEQVAELISSLEKATLMAQQIGTTVEQNQLLQISSALRIAHHRLSAFITSIPSAAAENSLSSVDPMQLGEEENGEAEEDKDSAVEKVEEKMRECFIRNKRAKRPLSPSSAMVETSATEDRNGRDYGFDFDPHATKLRALDLIYQFRG